MRQILLLGSLLLTIPAINAADEPKDIRYDGKTLAEWVNGLQAKDANVRKKAADAIVEVARRNREAARSVVEKMLDTDDADENAMLQRAENFALLLRELGAPAAHALHSHLWKKDVDKKLRALIFLAQMGRQAEPALPGVIEILEKDADPMRFRAALYVAQRNPHPTVLPVLIRLLDDPSPERSELVAGTVGDIDQAIDLLLPFLKKWLRGDDADQRFRAFTHLFRLYREATPALDEIISILKSQDALECSAAAMILQRIGPAAKKAVPELEKLLKSDDAQKTRFAARALLTIADHPQAKDELSRIIKEGKTADRLAVATDLWIHSRSPLVPPAIAEILKKGEGKERRQAIRIAHHLGPAIREALPILIEALDNSDMDLQTLAIQTLGRIGPDARKAIEPLKKCLKDGNEDVRYFAAIALARIEAGPIAIAELSRLLDSKNPEYVSVALRVLGSLKDTAKDALPAIRAKRSHAEGYVRLDAFEAEWFIAPTPAIRNEMLAQLRKEKPGDRYNGLISFADMFRADAAFAVDDLIAMLWEDTTSSPPAETFGWIGPAAGKAVPSLQRILLAPGVEAQLCSASAEALGMIGADAKPAIPALKQMLNHSDALVRVHAAFALIRIDGDKSGEPAIARSLLSRKHQVRVTALEAQWLLKKDDATIVSLIQESRTASFADHDLAGNHRFMAARALGRIGPRAKAALPDLKDLLFDGDPTLQRHVADAIAKIEVKK